MKSKKRSLSPLSPLDFPAKSNLISTPSSTTDYQLYHFPTKKISLETYQVTISRQRLVNQLSIYQWRKETEFPIVRTKYVTFNDMIFQYSGSEVKVQIYNEHIPLRVKWIYEMSLAQTLYLLKESVLGFERLYNRFGPFQVRESMIGVNESGFCRVWLNQVFSINQVQFFAKNQAQMLQSIYSIMSNHCQQNKATRKLFSIIKGCHTFLSALKQLQFFISTEKVLVPGKYNISNSTNRVLNPQKSMCHIAHCDQSQFENFTVSKVSNKTKKTIPSRIVFDNFQEKPISNYSVNSHKLMTKMKSIELLMDKNLMKISDDKTAYSHNNRDTKCSKLSRMIPNEKLHSKIPRNWMENSRFIMEINEDVLSHEKEKKEKNQLSHSTNMILNNDEGFIHFKDRKLSANICCNNKKQDSSKKEVENKQSYIKVPRRNNRMVKQIQNQNSQKVKKVVVVDNIIKNNGWSLLQGVLTTATDLKQSFHEGQDEESPIKRVELKKLDSLGRRLSAMSFVEDFEEFI